MAKIEILLLPYILSTFRRFSPAPVDLFSRSRLRGMQGARLYTAAQVWVPGGVRGACSGRSKSRNLASNHGVAFRGARAEQDNGKPTCQPLRHCCNAQQYGNINRFKLYSVLELRALLGAYVDHFCACVVMMYACIALCVCSVYMCTCVRIYP